MKKNVSILSIGQFLHYFRVHSALFYMEKAHTTQGGVLYRSLWVNKG